MKKRRVTKPVYVGGVKIGGGADVTVQSMTKTDTRDVAATVEQIKGLEEAGIPAAAIQLDTCSPNFMIQEWNANDLHSEIFVEPIRFENGYITPPTGPGLGVELDEDEARRYAMAGEPFFE